MSKTFSDDNAPIRDYRERRTLYADFAATLASLVRQILQDGSINIHSVTHRAKEVVSLDRKVAQQGRSYATLGDLTDLAGVRVTTYFHDDVDKAARLIEREFQIDTANSMDKRSFLDPDRFGYVSLHYVVALSSNRSELPEYRRFQGLKAELQLRSLLQHVWAEIEHDLGYKSARSVPAIIRRRFARLSGLLELADAEFVAIREELSAYEREVPHRIETEPAAVPLDRASLLAFQGESKVLKRVDAAIASYAAAVIVPPADSMVSSSLADLSFVGISTIAGLEAALHKNEDAIKRFAKLWIGGSRYNPLVQGISLFYLTYVLLARERNRDRMLEWARLRNLSSAEEIPERAIKTATEAGI